MQLPVGFRFNPTEQEILGYYLINKVKGEPLPSGVIYDCDLYGDKFPWEIFPRSAANGRLFAFTKLKKASTKRVSRTFACGEWRGNTGGEEVMDDAKKKVIGIKKTLSFKVKNSKLRAGRSSTSTSTKSIAAAGGCTGWVMHEYSLSGTESDYVLCEILNKEKKPQMQGSTHQEDSEMDERSLAIDQCPPPANSGESPSSSASSSAIVGSGSVEGCNDVQVPTPMPTGTEAPCSYIHDSHVVVNVSNATAAADDMYLTEFCTDFLPSVPEAYIPSVTAADSCSDDDVQVPSGSQVHFPPSLTTISSPPVVQTWCSSDDQDIVMSENAAAAADDLYLTDFWTDVLPFVELPSFPEASTPSLTAADSCSDDDVQVTSGRQVHFPPSLTALSSSPPVAETRCSFDDQDILLSENAAAADDDLYLTDFWTDVLPFVELPSFPEASIPSLTVADSCSDDDVQVTSDHQVQFPPAFTAISSPPVAETRCSFDDQDILLCENAAAADDDDLLLTEFCTDAPPLLEFPSFPEASVPSPTAAATDLHHVGDFFSDPQTSLRSPFSGYSYPAIWDIEPPFFYGDSFVEYDSNAGQFMPDLWS
ncbi:NAC domain-containing protein 102 [Linum perenne]